MGTPWRRRSPTGTSASSSTSEVFAYVNDHLGTPRELVDERGRVAWAACHTAFGALAQVSRDPAARQVESPFRLLGQYADEESGLAYTKFRYFDPATGRWCSPDPLGIDAGPNLLGWSGSPTWAVDPLGLATPLNQGGFSVYGLYHAGETSPYYVGITNDVDRRMGEHQRNSRLGPTDRMETLPGESDLTYAEARGHEQAYMEEYGTKPIDGRGEFPENVNNGFDKSRTDERGQAFKQEYDAKRAELDQQRQQSTGGCG
jgi:RHS repeat-associated protein